MGRPHLGSQPVPALFFCRQLRLSQACQVDGVTLPECYVLCLLPSRTKHLSRMSKEVYHLARDPNGHTLPSTSHVTQGGSGAQDRGMGGNGGCVGSGLRGDCQHGVRCGEAKGLHFVR